MQRELVGRVVVVLAVTGSALLLSGCAGQGGNEAVTYSAHVESGTIMEVRYDYVDGPNGAVSMPDNPRSARWSAELDGGHRPRLVVTPTPGGVAHCQLLAAGSPKRVLASSAGKPGLPVTCQARIDSQ